MKRPLPKSFGWFMAIALFAPLGPSFAQTNESPVAAKEVTHLRDRYAKHYELPDGKFRARISAGSQHFQDANGNWQDIVTDILPASGNFAFENTTNNLSSFFPTNIGAGNSIKVVGSTGASLHMSGESFYQVVDASMNFSSKQSFAAGANAQVLGNTVTYPGTGILDHHYAVENDMLKHNVMLNQLPANLPQGGYLAFGDVIELPAGYTLENQGAAINSPTYAKGALLINSADLQGALAIPVPDVYEQGNIASTIYPNGDWPISYYVEPMAGNKYSVSVLVPVSWLTAPGRNFPIVVDPTVNELGNWGGWHNGTTTIVEGNPTMFVFTGVLGADNYRAWVKFDITSVPDNSLVTDVEAEMFMNGTDNPADVATASVNDVTGVYGPYNSYNASAFTDFSNGQYTTYQCSTAVAYSAINLGLASVGHVQTQLPNDEYQISIDNGSNASSWKRYTSNLCNLDITYIFCTPPTFSITNITNPTCFGSDDGSVMTTATGGVPPYSYTWTGYPDTTSSIDSLTPGMYVVTIIDDIGCFDTIQFTVTEPDSGELAMTQTDVLCFGDATGATNVVATGGTAPYTYSWSTGGTAASENNVPSGTHTVTVTDANGCTYENSVFVPEPAELVASVVSITDATCGGDEDGMIVTSIAGGIVPYQVQWDDPNAQLSQTAVNLGEGLWTMMVTDANGCNTNTNGQVGATFPAPVIDLGPDVAADDLFYDITAPAGFVSYLWSTGANSSQIRVYSSDTYTVTVTDNNSCTNSDEIVISAIWPSGINDLLLDAEVQLYPNPTEGMTTLLINGLSGQDITMDITDVRGKIVSTRSLNNVASTLREELDLRDQAPGIYFVRLTAENKVGVLRLTVH